MKLSVLAVESLRRFARPGWRAKTLYGIFRGLFALIPIRRKLVLESLRLSFPEKDLRWRRDTLKRIYRHYAWMIVEVLAAQNDPSLVLRMVSEVEGQENLDWLCAQKIGCFILTGHMSNWELCGAWVALSGYPLETAVRDTDDPDFAELIEKYRQNMKITTLRKGALGVRTMVKHALQGKWVALLSDQDAGRDAVPVWFLGRHTTMVEGPAALSLTAQVPLIPIYSIRLAPFRYKMCILPPLATGQEGRSRGNIVKLTLKANETLEEMVRRAPEQWFWFHRRWKTNPDTAQA